MVLEQCKNDLSRTNIMAQAANLKSVPLSMLLPGITMSMAADNYNLFRKIQLMRFDGKRWAIFGEPINATAK